MNKKNNLNSGSTRRILDGFLRIPEKESTFEELRCKATDDSETQIRESLLALERSRILNIGFKRGRPKGGCRTKLYKISNDLAAFEKLSEIFLNNGFEEFLKSAYANKSLEVQGFIRILNVLQKNFYNDDFRKLTSKVLLEQPATAKEYNDYPRFLREMDEFFIEGKVTPYSHDNDLIQILSILDPFEAIEFYRKEINDTYIKLYREVTNEDRIIKDALKEFTNYDIQLSPFTSYPVNDPVYLLFIRPFERIYDNGFILSESDHKKFINRAYTVYSHFADILCSGINSLRMDEISSLDYRLQDIDQRDAWTDHRVDHSDEWESIRSRWDYLENIKNDLETLVRLSIYYWNIASYRFNSLNNFLNYEVKHFDIHHIFLISPDKEGKSILSSDRSKKIIGNISLLSGSESPFEQLWPCNAFDDLDLETRDVTYEAILEEVKSKIEDLKSGKK